MPGILQPRRKTRGNHETRSQAVILNFMMKFEDVVCQAKQSPFHFNLDRAAQKKSAEAHVLFGHGKNTLGLDAAIHSDQLSFVGADALFISSLCLAKRLET